MTKMWANTRDTDGTKRIHVYPLNDVQEHDLSPRCPCQPRIEDVEKGVLVVHHSFDLREYDEQAATVERHGNA